MLRSAVDQPPSARTTWLAAVCAGDDALLTEIETLLKAEDTAASFIESPVVRTALGRTGGSGTAAQDTPIEPPQLDGRTISHYRLESRIGAGGMGVVYRARDLALGREAALKILPDSFAPALRDRLRQEADACARLQHPAIATYYESGDTEGVTFIAMELVHGPTLRQRLRSGPLSADEAIAMVACLLEGLSHAHAVGILHRDIKPENIILTKERAAKLLDFGLAKSLLAAGPDAETMAGLTGGGAIAGTIGYMSPEQIRNDPLDVRSDLFQVGAVLYEALSGRPAFGGLTATERLAAVLSKDIAPLTTPPVPAELNAVLARALARDPSRRYPSAPAFLSDLIKVSAGEWTADLPQTIAVLDFQNLTGAAADDWIGSGMAESLGVDLGRAGGLTVVPRAKVLKARASLRSTDQDSAAVELGLALACRWVLAGEYRRLGPALRVTTKLVAVSTTRVIATERLDGTVEQIFDMEDRLVAATRASLAVEASADATTPPRTISSAYECYARGQRLFSRLEKGSFDQARELFEQAAQLDPGYAKALSGLAGISALRFTYATDADVLEEAISYGRRAIEADPLLAEAHLWLGYALWRSGHLAEADAEWQRTRELEPSWFYGFYFGAVAAYAGGKPDEALRLARRAVELEPTVGVNWWCLGAVHLKTGHYVEAASCFERNVRVNALHQQLVPGISGYWGECLRLMGHLDEARARCFAGLEEVERTDFMYRDSLRVFCLVTLGRVAMEQGDLDATRAAFDQAIAHVKGRPRTLAGGTLVVQALAGLARAGKDAAAYEAARTLDSRRHEFDFSWLWLCEEDVTCLDLARAAHVLGRSEDVRAFLERARQAGSVGALQENWL
jgi:tetratricopeptide (TPR) repeat protein